MGKFGAAIKGAREIAMPIISMTVILAAVYAPIGFLGGLTGALFTEFAFTLASTVIISGILALTLSPMMCSKILSPDIQKLRYVHFVDRSFEKLKNFYQRRLHGTLNFLPVMLIFSIVVLASCFFLYTHTASELAPGEDQGVLFVSATAPEYANSDYVSAYSNEFNKIYKKFNSMEDYFVVNGMMSVNSAFSAMIMKPWTQRTQSQKAAQAKLQPAINKIAGFQTVVFPLASLPGGGTGLPLQFVLNSVDNFQTIYPIAERLEEVAEKSGLFIYINNTLKFDKPDLIMNINRNKAGDLGINMRDLGALLAYSLGGNYVNRFPMMGRSYEVIPQVSRLFRLNPKDLGQIYIDTASEKLIPLSSIVSMDIVSQPNSRTHFQQLNSATIEGVMAPGKTMSQGIAFLKKEAAKILPPGMSYGYAGQSRQYIQEGNVLLYTFFLAIIIIYLVLAAQFESFRDPLIILISVPMSISGALIPLNLGLATINIYTQIGLITLIGLISKHGILMVEFANRLQATEGLSVREAIEKAAAIRLRPILMTTAAMVLGVVPLILATGAGAVSRFDIGLVISVGMLVGTCFTMFVVPTMYCFIAKKHKPLPQVAKDDI